MRLILAALLVFVAGVVGVVGWSGQIRIEPLWAKALDTTVTGATTPGPTPIRRVPQPVKVIVAQAPEAPSTEPTDLTEPPEPAAAPAPVRPTPAPGPAVDKSALRYFARQGDQRRLDAEIARLRALYPDWVPPADPTAPEIFVDPGTRPVLAPLLRGQIRRGAERHRRAPRARTGMDAAGGADRAPRPGGRPHPADQRLQRQAVEDRGRHRRGDAEPPHLRLCRRALAGGGSLRQYRADAAGQGRLRLHPVHLQRPGERLATVQKAADVLPEADFDALLVYEREGEFGPVRDTILRRRVGMTAENPELTSTPEDLGADRGARGR